MTLHDNSAFPLQGELSRDHFGENNHLYLKKNFKKLQRNNKITYTSETSITLYINYT